MLVCDTGACAWTEEVSWSTINKSATLSAWMPLNTLCLFPALASFVKCQTTDSKPLLRSFGSFTNIRRSAPLSLSSVGNVTMSPSTVTCPPVAPLDATSSSMHWSSAGSTNSEPCSWGSDATIPSKNFFHSSPLMLRRPKRRVVISSTATSWTCLTNIEITTEEMRRNLGQNSSQDHKWGQNERQEAIWSPETVPQAKCGSL